MTVKYKTVGVAKTAKYLKQKRVSKAKSIAQKYLISESEYNDAIELAKRNVHSRYTNLLGFILKRTMSNYTSSNDLGLNDRQYKDLQALVAVGFEVDFKTALESYFARAK